MIHIPFVAAYLHFFRHFLGFFAHLSLGAITYRDGSAVGTPSPEESHVKWAVKYQPNKPDIDFSTFYMVEVVP